MVTSNYSQYLKFFDIRYGSAGDPFPLDVQFIISNEDAYLDYEMYYYTLVTQGRVQDVSINDWNTNFVNYYSHYFSNLNSEEIEEMYFKYYGSVHDPADDNLLLPFQLWHYEAVLKIHNDMINNPSTSAYSEYHLDPYRYNPSWLSNPSGYPDGLFPYGTDFYYGIGFDPVIHDFGTKTIVGNDTFDGDGYAIDERPVEDYQNGKTFLFPGAIPGFGNSNWNFNSPAVREYAVQCIVQRALDKNGYIYLDNVNPNYSMINYRGVEVEYLQKRDSLLVAGRQPMIEHYARLYTAVIIGAQERYFGLTGNNIKIRMNGLYVEHSTHYVTYFQNEFFKYIVGNDIEGGFAETKVNFHLIEKHISRISEFNNDDLKMIYQYNVSTRDEVDATFNDLNIYRLFLFYYLIAQDNTYFYVGDGYRADGFNSTTFENPMGEPIDPVAYYDEVRGVWRREYQRATIVFDDRGDTLAYTLTENHIWLEYDNPSIDNPSTDWPPAVPDAGYFVAIAADDGSDDNGDGSITRPWLTISYALTQSGPGDTIYVRGGTYNEGLNITQGEVGQEYLTIKAYPDETPIIIPREPSTGWIDIGDNKWSNSVSKDDNYTFGVTDNLLLWWPVLVREDVSGINRVDTLDELDNSINVNPSIASYDLFYSEENGNNIDIYLYLQDGTNPNTETNIYILGTSDRVLIVSPNIEVNGLTIKYSYDGVKVTTTGDGIGNNSADNVRVLNNTIEYINYNGILASRDNGYYYNNTVRYCGRPLKYNLSDPSAPFLVENNQDHCIYFQGTNGIIDGNYLEKSYGQELHPWDTSSTTLPANTIIRNNFVKGQFILSGRGNIVHNNIILNDIDNAYTWYSFTTYAPYDCQVYNNLFLGNGGVYARSIDDIDEYLEFRNNIVIGLVAGYLGYFDGDISTYKFSNNIYYSSKGHIFWANGGQLFFADYLTYMNGNDLETGTIDDEPLFVNDQSNPDNYSATDYIPTSLSPVIEAGLAEGGGDLTQRNPSVIFYNPYDAGELDLGGQARISGDVVDIGPFEYQGNSSSSSKSSSSSSSSKSSSSSSSKSSSSSSSKSSSSSSSKSSSSRSSSSRSSSSSSSSRSSSSSSRSSSSSKSSSSSSISSSSSSSSSTGGCLWISNGGTINMTGDSCCVFNSVPGDTATIIINGVNFIIKNDGGSFVWDNNSLANKKTFATINEYIIRRAGESYIKITYDGVGSLLFSIEFTTFYESVSDLISTAQDRGTDISLSLLNMKRDLENSEITSDNIDKKWLFEGVNTAYKKANLKHNNYSKVIIDFVFKLQVHIATEYGSVDSYLEDNNIQVPQTFADISNAVGFTIDASNIE